MFRSLYAKLMVTFMAILMIVMMLVGGLFYQRVREDKVEARLSELTMQAHDVAFLRGQLYVQNDVSTQRFLMWKATGIMRDFDANVLIFDRFGQVLSIGDDKMELVVDELMKADTQKLLERVIAGKDITVLGMDSQTGNPVFTVGVPFYAGDAVVGGVFIHTSEQSVEASYRDVVKSMISAALIALSIGSVMILFVCQYITQPLRAMAKAADRFARGEFDERVPVLSRDEVGRLAEAFNSMARDLDRLETMRREFVANVSHELRSPLTSIQGFLVGILDGTVPEEEAEKYLGIVLDESRRLAKLITTLLDMSRIESGQTPLKKTSFDINEMIARVLVRQEAQISARDIDVDLQFAIDPCAVFADSDRIEQVLVNLIDNAIKFTGDNGKITVSTRKGKDGIHIAVQDNGPGIPKEDLPFVLERFYTANKAHTTGTGSGLGLSIAKSIIEQHGHRIQVESTPGEGATFSFVLDVAKEGI